MADLAKSRVKVLGRIPPISAMIKRLYGIKDGSFLSVPLPRILGENGVLSVVRLTPTPAEEASEVGASLELTV